MLLFTGSLFISLGICILASDACCNISSLDIQTNYPNYLTHPSTYLDELFNVSIGITYNLSNSGYFDLKLNLTFNWHPYVQLDIMSISIPESPTIFTINPQNINNVQMLSLNSSHLNSSGIFTIFCTTIMRRTPSSAFNNTIQLTTTATFGQEWSQNSDNQTINSTFTRVIFVMGPQITTKAIPSLTNLEAGVSFSINFQILLIPEFSTENATNFNVVLTVVSSFVSITSVSTDLTPHPSLANSWNQSFVGILDGTNTFSNSMNLVVLDSYEIGAPFAFQLNISFTGTNRTDKFYRYIEMHNIWSSLKIVGTVINVLPRYFSDNDSVSLEYHFTMPKGRLSNVNIAAKNILNFHSPSVWPISLRLLSTSIAFHSSGPSLSPASSPSQVWLQDMTVSMTAPAGVTGSRVKRSAPLPGSGQVVVMSPLGISIVNPASGGVSGASVVVQTNVGPSPSVSAQPPGDVNADITLHLGVNTISLASSSLGLIRPYILVTKNFTFNQNEKRTNYPIFTTLISIKHDTGTTAPFTNLTFSDDVTWLTAVKETANMSTPAPAQLDFSSTSVSLIGRISLATSQSILLSYSTSIQDGDKFPVDAATYRAVTVTYSYNAANYGIKVVACLYRLSGEYLVDNITNNYVILFLLLGIILGFLIVLLILYLLYRLCRHTVSPMLRLAEEGRMEREGTFHEGSKKLRLACKTGDMHTLLDDQKMKSDDTIAKALTQPNRQATLRALDTLDVLYAREVDMDISRQFSVLRLDALDLLVASMVAHGSVPKPVYSHVIPRFHKEVQTLETKMEERLQDITKEKSKKILKKNKWQLSKLLEKQVVERATLEEAVKYKEAPSDVLLILDKQHDLEVMDLAYQLKLKEEEQMEKLRNKVKIQSETHLEDLERGALCDVIGLSNLNSSQSDWLLKEHKRIKEKLSDLHSDELAKQRLKLEERLEKRRLLAKYKDLEDEANLELVDTVSSQTRSVSKKLLNQGAITPEQAEEYLEQHRKESKEVLEQQEARRKEQEKALVERLSQAKAKRIKAKMSEQQHEFTEKRSEIGVVLQDLTSGAPNSTEEAVDPVEFLSGAAAFLSRQRQRRAGLEDEVDTEDAQEVVKLFRTSGDQTTEALVDEKKRMFDIFRNDGVSESQLNKIMTQHTSNIETLKADIDADRTAQRNKLAIRLAERQVRLVEEEKLDRLDRSRLNVYEKGVIQGLLDCQVAISEEERDRILKDHENNMMQLDTNLTLNRLSQKQKIEEVLQQRKNAKMEKLKKKQEAETRRLGKKHIPMDSDDEMNDDDLAAQQREERDELLRRQAQERLDLLSGAGETESEEKEMAEMERIREAMLRERAEALKAQEERVAAMIGQLQMAKAKELAKIEEQQKAIEKLKMNLVDCLNNSGTLSDSKCQAIIEKHEADQTELIKKLDKQRAKQEQLIMKRMADRIREKEELQSIENQREMKTELETIDPGDKTSIQIRKSLILQRQMVETEQMRTRLQHECNQMLEEARRELELTKQQFLQTQEVSFVAGLVRLGKFSRRELLEVMKVLFPLRTRDQLVQMLDQISPPKEPGKETPVPDDDDETLTVDSQIIRKTKDLSTFMSNVSLAASKFLSLSPTHRKRSDVSSKAVKFGSTESHNLTPIGRPEPVGSENAEEAEKYRDPQDKGKKKKKKKSKMNSVQPKTPYDDDFDNDDF